MNAEYTLALAAEILAKHACFYCKHGAAIPVQAHSPERGTGTAIREDSQHVVTWQNGRRERVWCDARVIWSALEKRQSHE
jgi:hypothetical protein